MGRLSKWLYTCVNRRKVSKYKKIPNSASSLVELDAETVEIHIFSIKCASCAANVEILLKNITGVYDVTVNVVSKIAYVTFDPTLTSPEKILDVVIENSHTAVIGARNKKEWRIVYLKCQKNVWNTKFEERFNVYKLKHIRSYRKTHYFSVEYLKKNHAIRKVFQELEAVFQNLEIVDVSDVYPSQNKAEVKYWRNMCLISSIFGVVTMALMILEHNNPKLSKILITPGLSYTNLVLFICSTIVQVVVGRSIYVSAIRSIRTGLNMNFLISTATTVAYLYSCIVLIVFMVGKYQYSAHTFFDTPPMLYMIVSLGRYIECKSRMHSVTSIRKLMKPNKHNVTIFPDSKNYNIHQEISSDLIEESDILHVYHGMCVPCDGVIYETDSPGLFNESVITGESLPVRKNLFDEVFCGSINEGNPLKMKVTRTGHDCRVQQITRCVQVALSKKIPLNNVVDTFSRLFTPGILFLSIITFFAWIICFHYYPNLAKKLNIDSYLAFTFQTSISVLCVACPCAIGLAIPLAVMISTGVGAKLGILIKGAPPLQSMARVKKIVFDKTGTLTVGIPTVEKFCYDSCDDVEIYKTAFYSIVSFSNHILSRSIKKYFENCNFNTLNIQNYKEISGLGLSGKVVMNIDLSKCDEDLSMVQDDPGTDNKNMLEVVMGNEEMLNLNSIIANEAKKLEASEYASSGATIVYAAIKYRFLGYFVIRDEIRNDAEQTIHYLSLMGIESIMLTGDTPECATYVAKKIGIFQFYYSQSPESKSEVIEKLGSSNSQIAMVGDGVNDIIAMAQSTVGIAMGNHVDITAETANVVIMNNKLISIIDLITLSKLTMRTVKRNLVFSSIYNLLSVPIAAGCLRWTGLDIQPWVASVSMVISSLSVTFSSMTILLYKPQFDTINRP